MTSDQKDPGGSSALSATGISPTFTANDLQASIRFYTEGLGFEITERHEVEGTLRFVRLRSGQASLGVGQDDFAKGRDRSKGVGMRIWLSTSQDVGPLAERVRAAGYALTSEPGPLPWGPQAFSLDDPDGFQITLVEGEQPS
jgi:catechol 2,3-dioxygenase-like lactoylglutathione lyase family enzyme